MYGIEANVLDCGIVVSEFELQLRYYVNFREKHFQESYERLYYLA